MTQTMTQPMTQTMAPTPATAAEVCRSVRRSPRNSNRVRCGAGRGTTSRSVAISYTPGGLPGSAKEVNTMASTQREPDVEPGLEQVWAAPLQAVARAKHLAREVYEETIWDAAKAGMNPTQIARVLGTRDRKKIYAVTSGERSRSADAVIERPALLPAVYLRGAQAGEDVWERVKEAMWRRGWYTVLDRTAAWHLSRGRLAVILVDFSVRTRRDLKVGMVRAKFGERKAAGQEAPMELPMTGGWSQPLTYDADGQLDVEDIAVAVQGVIGTSML